MGLPFRDFRFIALRRIAALWAAAALTVIVALGVVIESTDGVPAPVVPVVIAVPVWLAFTKRTNLALATVLLYMGLLDGVVKLSTGSQLATLGRDVLLYAAAIGIAARSRGPRRLPPLSGWVFAWVAAILVQVANPRNASMFHAVASTRQDLEFVPLFFIGFVAVRTKTKLHAFFALMLALASVNAIVAVYQSTLTPAQLATWGPGYANLLTNNTATRTFQAANGQSAVRPPALGSDEGFGGVLGATALPGGIVLLIAYRRRRWLLAPILLGVVGAAVGVLTSQSRAAVIMAVVGLLAVLALVGVGRQAGRALIGLLAVAAIAFVGVEVTASYSQNAFARYSSIAPGSAGSTIVGYRSSTWALIPVYMREIPLGAGLGLVASAAGKAGGTAGNWNAESEFTYLIVEAGIPGLLVLLGFQCMLFRTVVSGLRRERDPEVVVLMAGLAAPLFGYFAGWFVGVYTAETPGDAFLWFAAGVLSWWLVTRQREMRVRGLERRDAPSGRELQALAAGALSTTPR